MAEDTRKRPEFSSDYSSAPRESGGDPLAAADAFETAAHTVESMAVKES